MCTYIEGVLEVTPAYSFPRPDPPSSEGLLPSNLNRLLNPADVTPECRPGNTESNVTIAIILFPTPRSLISLHPQRRFQNPPNGVSKHYQIRAIVLKLHELFGNPLHRDGNFVPGLEFWIHLCVNALAKLFQREGQQVVKVGGKAVIESSLVMEVLEQLVVVEAAEEVHPAAETL